MLDLQKMRKDIDVIDTQIVKLFEAVSYTHLPSPRHPPARLLLIF